MYQKFSEESDRLEHLSEHLQPAFAPLHTTFKILNLCFPSLCAQKIGEKPHVVLKYGTKINKKKEQILVVQ